MNNDLLADYMHIISIIQHTRAIYIERIQNGLNSHKSMAIVATMHVLYIEITMGMFHVQYNVHVPVVS